MTWRQKLDAGRVPLLDGGTGSELRRRGIELSGICWSAAANLTHADCLSRIHRDYLRAGADIVTANTFAATRFVLEPAALAAKAPALIDAAVAAARAAAADAGRDVTLAASISCLPPRFDRSAYPRPDAEYRAYAELAGQLADRGVDLLLLEMLQQPAHARRVCRAVEAVGLPYWTGLSCRLAPAAAAGRPRLVAFDDPAVGLEAVLDVVLEFSPEVVAIMHTPIDAMLPALDRLRADWSGPIAAYAEIPYPEDPATAVAERLPPPDYAAAARDWLAHGASILGGCCGTTPAHITALRELTAIDQESA